MSPSAAFMRAAKTSRNPVALLAVESVGALKASCGTAGDWYLAKSLSRVDTATVPGDVVGPVWVDTQFAPDSAGTGNGKFTFPVTVAADTYFARFTGNIFATNQATCRVRIRQGTYFGTILWESADIALMSGTTAFDVAPPYLFIAAGTVLVLEVTATAGDWHFSGTLTVGGRYKTGTVRTMTLDLGAVPAIPSQFEADDILPAGSAIAYTGRGSNTNNGSDWVELGAVTDGGTLAAYRYYDILATITTNGPATATIQEVRVIGGDSQFDYYSTHRNTPVKGARPYLAENGLSSLTSKIELLKPSTVGELSAKLFWRRKTGDMIATGYLKNKTVTCKLGFEGLAEKDFEPYFTGIFYDHSDDHDRRIIDIKMRDILKRFRQKVPAEDYFLDANGNKVEGKVYTLAGNVCQVMLDIADVLGIPDRYLDRGAFAALRDGARSGSDWNIRRDLGQTEDAYDLMNELAVSAGLFVVPLADGRLTCVDYDAAISATPAGTLDAMHHTFAQIEGGQAELSTRQAIYYQLIPGKDGGSNSDYGKAYIYVNAEAETHWGESVTKEWLDRWGLSTVAIQRLAQRFDSWFANPRLRVKVSNVPPRFMGLRPGSVVEVDNLRIPCPAAQWEGFSDGVRFLVMAKTIDPKNLTLSFELYQVGALSYTTNPSFPAYQPLNLFPPVTGLALAERLSRRADGTIDDLLDVSFTQPADFHYGSAEVWVQVDGGTWGFSGPVGFGGPNTQRVYSLPVAEGHLYKVAVLTVNMAGRRMPIDVAPTATLSAVGKTAAPSNVAGFAAVPNNEWVDLSWSHIPDGDRAGYEIRLGDTWDTGRVLKTFESSDRMSWRPDVSGTLRFWIRAMDTSGNPSALATSSNSITITPPSMTSISQQVIDNFVLLRWGGAKGTFPIRHFEVRKGAEFASAEVIGTINGTFKTHFETASGTYKYWVVPIDVNGVYGTAMGVYATVSQPPDFILWDRRDLAFGGTKVNCLAEDGSLIAPINLAETVDGHFTSHAWTSPQDQINAGYPVYIQPGVASGSYEEVIDYGAPLSCKVTLDVTRDMPAGTVTINPTISVSPDNVNWTNYAGVYSVYASSFRYVKYHLDFTSSDGGVIRITKAQAVLDVKQKTFEGMQGCNAADTGGTVVDITGKFIDVQSIQVTPQGTTPIQAVYDFTDTPNPTQFKILLFNSAGARVSGNASYIVRGV